MKITFIFMYHAINFCKIKDAIYVFSNLYINFAIYKTLIQSKSKTEILHLFHFRFIIQGFKESNDCKIIKLYFHLFKNKFLSKALHFTF